MDREFLRDLKAAGLFRFHHNLEAAASHFPQICTTHTYAERVATIEAAQAVGLRVCVGGIMGLGESVAQRWELAQALEDLAVDAIPLNFLHPLPGTALARPAHVDPSGGPQGRGGLSPDASRSAPSSSAAAASQPCGP